jgi:hypothetical protein
MNTDSGGLTIGFVSMGLPLWYLFVGGTGRSKWIVGNWDLLMRRKGDPPVVVEKQDAFETMMRQEPVNTVVFEGRPPSRDHAVWDSLSIRAVLWIPNRRMQGGAKPPAGWRWKRIDVRHEECGGVSNGVFVSLGACKRWRKEVESSFWKWYRKTAHRPEDKRAIREAGIEACLKASQVTWWEWNGGSATFFWRWPDDYQRDLWEGSPPWFVGKPPTGKEKQRPYKLKEAMAKVK